MGVERLINEQFGIGRKDDTLPDRWFDEPITVGAYKGEKIDRDEFQALLSRFYAVSGLTDDGLPNDTWRGELGTMLGPAS
jgi:aldehyde:ferredoxin oxidoreductase